MSGAGKSTLVRCINMLERPTEGSVVMDGTDLAKLSDKQLREVRRRVTMIFQGFNLLMQRNCLSNICFPLELEDMDKKAARAKAMELLEVVGLADKAKAYPAQLSGGQQQRIAIARALATNPQVLLCDEATSALDPNTTNSILDLIREINQKLHITVIIITHQMSVVEQVCKNVAILENGNVVEVGAVTEVFAHPKSEVAKKLVYPEGGADLEVFHDNNMIRVIFNGADAADKPLIARMAVEKGIMANIAYASTKTISGKAYGNMLLSIEGDAETLSQALAYLETIENVTAQEVAQNA